MRPRCDGLLNMVISFGKGGRKKDKREKRQTNLPFSSRLQTRPVCARAPPLPDGQKGSCYGAPDAGPTYVGYSGLLQRPRPHAYSLTLTFGLPSALLSPLLLPLFLIYVLFSYYLRSAGCIPPSSGLVSSERWTPLHIPSCRGASRDLLSCVTREPPSIGIPRDIFFPYWFDRLPPKNSPLDLFSRSRKPLQPPSKTSYVYKVRGSACHRHKQLPCLRLHEKGQVLWSYRR